MQNKTLTSEPISFFSIQDAITDITKLLYKNKVVTRIKMSLDFYEKVEERFMVLKFQNGLPDRFYGVPLEVVEHQTEPYIIYYNDGEVDKCKQMI